MTPEQLQKIVNALRERSRTSENIAKDKALQMITGPQNEKDRRLAETEAREWARESRIWEGAAAMVTDMANEFFRADEAEAKRKKP